MNRMLKHIGFCMLISLMICSTVIILIESTEIVEAESPSYDDSNLKLHYTFDEPTSSSSVQDTSGNNYDGTKYNGATCVDTAKFGRAIRFDGTNDYVKRDDHNDFHFQKFTLEAWIFPESVDTDDNVISKSFYTGGAYGRYYSWGIKLRPGSTNHYQVGGVIDVNSANQVVWASDNIPLNEWTHVAVTWDGNSGSGYLRVYINGIQEASGSYSGSIAYNTNEISIGYYASDNCYFDGIIDEVKIFNDALTPSDGLGTCQLLVGFEEDDDTSTNGANGDTIHDRSGNGFSGSMVGGTYYGNGVDGSRCMYFDGTSDYLRMNTNDALAFTQTFTVEFWIWYSSPESFQGICGRFYESGGNYKGYLVQFAGGSQNKIRFFAATTSGDVTMTSTNTMDQSKWNHVVAVFDAPNDLMQLYVNGVKTERTSSLAPIENPPSSDDFLIGRTFSNWGYYTHYLTAYVDDVRVYDCVKKPTLEYLHMDFESWSDKSRFTNTITNDGVALSGNEMYGTYSGSFYASQDDYVSCGTDTRLAFTTEFTLEAWITGFTNHDSWAGICGRFQYNSCNYRGYAMYFNGATNNIKFFVANTGGYDQLISTSTVSASQWNHVMCVFDNGWAGIYINGVLDTQTDMDVTSAAAPSGVHFTIGKLYSDRPDNENAFYDGYIDNVVVSNRAKTGREDSDGDGMADNYEVIRGVGRSEQYNPHEYNGRYSALLVGGFNRINNHARYWNDMCWMYDLLRSYSFYECDIYVVYADGDYPDADNCRNPDDLIAHIDIIEYSATESNIQDVYTELGNYMTARDTLIVWTGDHGGREGTTANVCIYLWDDGDGTPEAAEELWDTEYAGGSNYLDKISNHRRIVHIMEQCHSGGFMANIATELSGDHVFMSACEFDDDSHVCDTEGSYNEFVYHVQAAFGWITPAAAHVDADADNDYLISMFEAFDYAETQDSVAEVPQLDDDDDGGYDGDDGLFSDTVFI